MTSSSVSRIKNFSIPSYNSYVEMVSFLATLRFYSRGTSLVKSPSYNAGHLKRIYINQYTADRFLALIPEARAWPANQHGIVVGLLHYKFHLDNDLNNCEFRLSYEIKPVHDQDIGYFPGFFPSEGNHMRGASALDRN